MSVNFNLNLFVIYSIYKNLSHKSFCYDWWIEKTLAFGACYNMHNFFLLLLLSYCEKYPKCNEAFMGNKLKYYRALKVLFNLLLIKWFFFRLHNFKKKLHYFWLQMLAMWKVCAIVVSCLWLQGCVWSDWKFELG